MKPLVFIFSPVLLLAVSPVVGAVSTSQPALATQPVEKHGLQVTVIGDKTVFARNEPINFIVRFKNVSLQPLSVFDAADFENWSIHLENVTSKMPWRLQGTAAEQPERSQPYRELRPGESLEVTTQWGANSFPFQYASELVLNLPIPPTDRLSPGRYQLWVGITLKKKPGDRSPYLGFPGDINVGPMEIEISGKDDPKGVQESEAVKEDSAEFQTVTRTSWLIPKAGEKSEVHLGLKMTNLSGRWMQINVFDTVQVVLKDSHGTELRRMSERDATSVPQPIMLESREVQTIFRNATLQWSEGGKGLRLIGSDGAGGNWHFDDLKPGKYTVHFVYENNENTLKSVLARPAKHLIDPKEAPFWMGTVATEEISVEVVN